MPNSEPVQVVFSKREPGRCWFHRAPAARADVRGTAPVDRRTRPHGSFTQTFTQRFRSKSRFLPEQTNSAPGSQRLSQTRESERDTPNKNSIETIFHAKWVRQSPSLGKHGRTPGTKCTLHAARKLRGAAPGSPNGVISLQISQSLIPQEYVNEKFFRISTSVTLLALSEAVEVFPLL